MAETEEIELGVDYEGLLQISFKKTWKPKYAILSGGGIYYKTKKKDTELKGPIEIKGGKIAKVDDKKKFIFSVNVGGKETLFAAEDEASLKKWMEVVTANLNKEVGESKSKKVKQTRGMRIKKNISGTVATSSAGKGIIKEFLGKEGVRLLEIVKEVITIHQGKKKATEIENIIIKLAVKVILLWKSKDLTTNDIKNTIPMVKAVWSDVIDFCEMSFAYDPNKIKKSGEELQVSFSKLLTNKMTEKNLSKLREAMTYLVTEDLLNILFQDDKQEELKKELSEILRKGWINVFTNDQQ